MDPKVLIEAMQDPQMRHAAMVHFPIVLSALGMLLALASAIFLGKNHTLRWVAFSLFAMMYVSVKFAQDSGELAEGAVGGMLAMNEPFNDQLHDHESMAQKLWWMAILCGLLVALSAFPMKMFRVATAWAAVLAGAGTTFWVALTAHQGGVLVYEHGAGAPSFLVPAITEVMDDLLVGNDGNAMAVRVDDPRMTHFREHVKPLLRDVCIACHNSNKARSDLDQTSITKLFEGGMSGPAVIPGNPDESWLIIAVRHEEDMEMPPNGDKLSDEVIEHLTKWIRDGAVWESLGEPVPKEDPSGGSENADGP
ncbi:MAG: hypothetical protein O7G85_14715 [Planctomycetota bacterium]|nr:hypothetical protein [Planctomycetota bacterium]